MSAKKLRLFVSTPMPVEVQQAIALFQKKIKKEKLCDGIFTNPNQAHITLKFLGPIDASKLSDIEKSLQTITFKKQKAQLGRVRWFDTGGKIDLLFFSVICPALEELEKLVVEVLQPWVPKETRMFVNHTTLMRVNEVHNSMRFLRFIEGYQVEPIEFMIDSFALMESKTDAEDAEHTVLKTYGLK